MARLAAGTDRGYVLLWDISSGTVHLQLEHGNKRVFAVAFDALDENLTSGGEEGSVRIWNLATGQPVRTLSGHQGKVYSAAYSSDNRLLVTVGGFADLATPNERHPKSGEVKLWDPASGELLGEFDGHRDTVCQAYFLADDKTLVTSAFGLRTLLWDVDNLLQWCRDNSEAE